MTPFFLFLLATLSVAFLAYTILELRGKSNEEVIFESFPNPILLIGHDRTIDRLNRAAGVLLGKKVCGQDLIRILRPAPLVEAVNLALEKFTADHVEFTWTHREMEYVFVAHLVPLKRTAQLMLILNDVTTVRRSEQMRDDFIANISHELRTPLSTVVGAIETLQGNAKKDPKARDKFLTIMHAQATRMSRMVTSLLSLSYLEAGAHLIASDKIALTPLLKTLVASMDIKAGQENITLKTKLPARLPLVEGDEDQLIQLFQNLIDNALKYSPADTVVTIEGQKSEAGNMIEILIKDQGKGISRNDLPRITERFYRGDSNNKTTSGLGLGLSIATTILDRHHGQIVIDSTVGKGSVFTVRLPIYEKG